MLKELESTNTYQEVHSDCSSVVSRHLKYMVQNDIFVQEQQEHFPSFYWLPKLHKKPYGARFIAASNKCTTKQLSSLLTSSFKTILIHYKQNCSGIYKNTGVNCFWIIDNSMEVLGRLRNINRTSRAKSFDSFDFSETFWQLLMEKEFIRMMQSEQETYSASVPDCSPGSTSARHLSCVEENAVRYTAGYVVRKLERKYSHQNIHEGTEWSTILKEMAGKLNTRDSTSYRSEQQSTKWTNLVDHGGLYYHVDDIVYELFVALEHLADKELTSIFQARSKGIEKIKKEELSWICSDDDVQFLWCMISPIPIECEEVRQHLLQEIAHL